MCLHVKRLCAFGGLSQRFPRATHRQDYLRGYLQLLADAQPLTERSQLARVREAQLAYACYRTERDPARGMLTRLFGKELTERLICEVLFNLPRVIHPA